ncbi:MAG: UDP-glucose 4-epimerase GalE [Verrucomicrobiae bacterium]|nr:UDP-glucose 4-epimerase GalE [Verrucomicrobiae bacterium]
MNALVTGGAGYIGSVCVEELLRAGHQVTVFDNFSEGHRSAVPSGARLIEGCLNDAAAVERAVRESGAEAVLHFAALALIAESMRDPGKYFRNNVGGGMNLLEACARAGVRKFVFSSTCATYGIPERVPIDESFPQRPINPYGASKRMFEEILDWHARVHGLEVVVFRYFNAAGASERLGEHHRVETHLIPNVLRVALGQAPEVGVFGTDYPTPDGTCVRDYIHIVDLADAHIRALEPGRRGAYNLGIGGGHSVREVIQACERVSGKPIAVRAHPRRDGDPPSLVASADKARRELGWEPRFTRLEDIVATAWEWHRRHPDGYPD